MTMADDVGPKYKLRFSSLSILVLIVALLVDSLLSDVSSIVNRALSEPARIVLFLGIGAIAIISGSGAILHNIRKAKAEVASTNKVLLLISRIIPYIQYTISGLLTLIILQIIFTHQYLNFLLDTELVYGRYIDGYNVF